MGDKEKYVVGRYVVEGTQPDLNLHDTSISRSHAFLYPVSDHVKLEDELSRYGTYVNEKITSQKRVPKDEHIFLRAKDLVQFGLLSNIWRLERVDISILTSNLDIRDSVELKSILRTLHGNEISSDWSNSVTHLVMSTLTITPKLLMALVNCVPVVNFEFFKAAVKTARETGRLPKESQFVPSLAKSATMFSDCDFTVDEARKSLFDGLNFIFLDESYFSIYQKVISSAGGMATMWDKKKSSIIRINSRVIVDHKANQNELNDYLKTKNRRLILGSEIGFAIIHKSINEYCNPKNSLEETQDILAEETPGVGTDNVKLGVTEVPETIDYANEVTVEKTFLRVVNKTIPPNATEVPETVQFPDDNDFDLNSQAIMDIVDRESEKSQKRKKTPEPEFQSSKRFHLEKSSQSKSLDLSQFMKKRVQREKSPDTDHIFDAPVAVQNKRTLAELLEQDDEEDNLFDFASKKSRPLSNSQRSSIPDKPYRPPKVQKIPSLIKTAPKPGPSVDVPDASSTPYFKITPVNISQSGWLCRKLETSLNIKSESLDEVDESRTWIQSLHDAFQIKEIKVNLSTSTSKSIPRTELTSIPDSGKRNYKSFRKQGYQKHDETVKTIRVVINGTI